MPTGAWPCSTRVRESAQQASEGGANVISPYPPAPRRNLQRILHAFCWQFASDAELLEEFNRSGEEEPFAVLVRRHGPMVLGICRRLLGNVHDAEDVFQATFLVLARKAASIKKGSSLASWLYAVATRLARRARAQAGRRRALEAQRPAPQRASPDAAEMELRTVLDEELGRLPENYRAVVMLCCLEGKSRSEAAAALGWKEGAVKVRLERARGLLRNRLERRGLAVSSALLTLSLLERAGAAVPPPLAAATVQAASVFAAGATAASLVSGRVLSLAVGGLQMFAVSKLKILGLCLATLVVGSSAALWTAADAQQPGQKARPILIEGENVVQAQPGTPVPSRAQIEGQTKDPLEQLRTQLERLLGETRTKAADAKTLEEENARFRELPKRVTIRLDAPDSASAAVSPDGKLVAVIIGDKVQVLDTATGKVVVVREATGLGQPAISFSPDGKILTIIAKVNLAIGKAETSPGLRAILGVEPVKPGTPAKPATTARPGTTAKPAIPAIPANPAKADLERRLDTLIEELLELRREIRGKK
jgi:RNA polymerase sigma factor (sigma-70 family)